MTIGPISEEDRRHGFQTLALVSQWSDWVRRRTETIQFVSDAAVQRRVAVDFRMPAALLRVPIVRWGDEGIHYLPLALLEKQPLAGFSLRDESGHALPLVTRTKNACIAAGALIALAQSIVAKQLRIAAQASLISHEFDDVTPIQIQLPSELELEMHQLCHFNYIDRGARRQPSQHPPDAATIFESFSTLGDSGFSPDPPYQWTWDRGSADEAWIATADIAAWKAALLGVSEFRDLADAFARTFLLSAPVAHSPGMRRVIKYSYYEPIREPVLAFWHKTKTAGPGPARAFARLRVFEDKLEGLPVADFPFDEWLAVGEGDPRETIKARTKLLRAATWRAKRIAFDTPAVGWGGSYHVEILAPEGTQVRRATLNAIGTGQTRVQHRALRGARNLDRAHLYIRHGHAGRTGTAEVALKACSSTIVRSAALTAVLVVGALIMTVTHLDRIQTSSGSLGLAGALLLIVPGVLAVYTARGGEHPMTTNLVYGLRVITTASGLWAVLGAGLALLGPATGARLILWLLLIVVAWVTAIILLVAWRLASRGRPLEQAITSTVGGA